MKTNSKSFIYSMASLAAMASVSGSLAADDDGKVTTSVSGQVNRAVLWADNGENTDVGHVDNDNSSTRFRFTGAADMSETTQAGIVWETEFESNASNNFDIDQNNDGSADFKERKLEAFYKGNWGKLSIGQGDGAANGTSEMDLSGTSVVSYSGIVDMAGGITFRSNGAPIGEGLRVKDVFDNFDGLSRNDRLRYDTPALGPVGLAVSTTNGDAVELAARLASDWGDSKFEAALGYVNGGDREDFDQIGASASFLHSSGFNVTVALGEQDLEAGGRPDPQNAYVKLGYHGGAHRFSVDFGRTEDLAVEDDEADTIGASWVWRAFKSAEIYVAYRHHELDRPGVDVDDVDAIMAGTRIKFF